MAILYSPEPTSPVEPRASQKIMRGLESLLRRHAQIDRVPSPSNPLPVELGIGEDLHRLREQAAARGHRDRGGALPAERLVLLSRDDEDAPGVGRRLGHQDVGAHVLPRRDDVLALPPYLGELLFKVDLLVGAEEGVGPGWLVG